MRPGSMEMITGALFKEAVFSFKWFSDDWAGRLKLVRDGSRPFFEHTLS